MWESDNDKTTNDNDSGNDHDNDNFQFQLLHIGEGVAWFIGWNLTLEYGVSASAIARAWSSYVATFINRYEHGG